MNERKKEEERNLSVVIVNWFLLLCCSFPPQSQTSRRGYLSEGQVDIRRRGVKEVMRVVRAGPGKGKLIRSVLFFVLPCASLPYLISIPLRSYGITISFKAHLLSPKQSHGSLILDGVEKSTKNIRSISRDPGKMPRHIVYADFTKRRKV